MISTDTGETTIALEWDKPAIPNGIVDGYMVRGHALILTSMIIFYFSNRSPTHLTGLPILLILRQNQYNL